MVRSKLNKSQLIREFLEAHKGKAPAEISALIVAEKGIEISPQYISGIKTAMKGKRKARKLSRKAESDGAGMGASPLFAAANLLVKAGGMEEARAALEAVAKVAAIVG